MKTLNEYTFNQKVTKANIARICLLITVVLIIFSLTSVFAFAAKCNCDAVEGEHTKGETFPCTKGWNILNKTAYQQESSAYLTNISTWDSFYKIDFDSGMFRIIWSGVKAIYQVIEPVGYLLVILYFVIDIIDHTTRDSLNVEHLIKMTIKLFIGILLITNGLDLLEGAASFGNAVIDLLNDPTSGGGSSGSAALQSIYNQIKDMKWYNCIGMMWNSFIPYLLNIISTIVIILVIYSRYIEIGIRALFAPIGMANVFEGGMNSSGMKYFKKYMAACFQGVIICAIMIVSSLVARATATSSGLLTIPGLNILPQLVVQLCTAGMIIKAKSFANDLLGVN